MKLHKENLTKRITSKTKMLLIHGDNDVVVPTLYDGHHVGNGIYMTGMVDNKIVEDKNGKPLPLKEIGILQ